MEKNRFNAVEFMRKRRDAISIEMLKDPKSYLKKLKELEERYKKLLEKKAANTGYREK